MPQWHAPQTIGKTCGLTGAAAHLSCGARIVDPSRDRRHRMSHLAVIPFDNLGDARAARQTLGKLGARGSSR
jgi:hypothetical protein